MGVRVHTAPHPDALVAMLGQRLLSEPADPFTSEIVSVPTRGIERWLTQRIAMELSAVAGGIAANIEFPTPHRLVRRIAATVPELAESLETWEGSAFLSDVIAALDEQIGAHHMALLRRHLDAPAASRVRAARKIARLFTRYARRRPDMIRAWAEGRDVASDGSLLDEHHLWQPALWRTIRTRLGTPSIPELDASVFDVLRTDVADLPARVAVYGLTAADPFDLDVLAAVGATRDVHLHILHPSPALWQRVDAVGSEGRDPTMELSLHPLLASWGRHSRQLQLVVSPIADDVEIVDSPRPGAGPSLLRRIQHDVEQNLPASEHALESADRSVQIHVCHGARRQVEVLRDAILHILADDPTLEPRDIVIMTPDLARFAPLLEAGFPQGGSTLPDLRVRIADRSPAATNPLVQFTAALLDLVDSRCEAASLRQLVTGPLIQNRFGFDADTADSIVRIIDDANVSWGFDGVHRQRWGVHGVGERSWRRGLDRALAGVFYTDSPIRVVGDAAPLDGIEGQDARPVGILAAVLDRLTAASTRLGQAMPLSEWAQAIGAAVRMLADPGWDDEWQWNQLERLLDETFPAGERTDPIVTLAEAQDAIRAWSDDRPSPLMFRTGDVTVCTLVPMRSVPYRVVCLLGMDDERFPRQSRSDGDDLLVLDRRTGDLDRAGEDRQLLLDAVMAAGDHLVITYSGRDEVTNADYPPAVPIAELSDVLERMVGTRAFRDHIRTRHPLQSFSRDVFIGGRLGVGGPWGFDQVQRNGAVAIQERDQTTLHIEDTWPSLDPPPVVRIEDLKRFLANPVRTFVSSQLGFGIPSLSEVADDAVPIELDALQTWALKDRIIDGLARGFEFDRLLARELASDALPPGQLAEQTIARIRSDVDALWSAAVARGFDRAHHSRFMGSVTVEGRVVEGVVFADPGPAHIPLVTPSTVKARHRLDAFVDLCFLSALDPDVAWHALILARHDQRRGFIEVTIGPLGRTSSERRERALAMLGNLIELFDEGHREPLALPCETSFAWQRNVERNRSRAVSAAANKFDGSRFSNERDDASHQMVFGEGQELDDLLTDRFEETCRRLWAPILPFIQESGL